MRFLASANALFRGLRVSASYHQALTETDAAKAKLRAAQAEVRGALRAASARIRVEARFWDSTFIAKGVASRPEVQPKFFTQGSFAYDLLIDPCQYPPQQSDLDDGLYFLVDFLQNGRPALVAKALFEFVEEALRPLCLKNGWTLVEKDTCVRVQISGDSHIDLPIYSAPRDVAESRALTDAAFAEGRVAKRAGQTYAKLPADKIMLAHRDGTWQPSDPLKLHEWVDGCAERYGPQFRQACRYFKGWRDFEWKNCCLSSITIMAAVQRALEDLGGSHEGLGDDRLVYEIAQMLPDIFRGRLLNPAFPGEEVVLNEWTDDERLAIVAAAERLADNMDAGLCRSGDQTLVVEALRRAFGARIPFRPDVVEILPPATAAVAKARPATVAAPRVTKSTSG